MAIGKVVRDEATAEFFDGAALGQLMLRKCGACGSLSAPQAKQCGTCGSTELSWQPASGGAAVLSWTITHSKPDADGKTRTQVLVIAELDEGPWWWSQVAGADPDSIQAGTRLRIEFERAGEDSEYIPVFRPE